MGLLFWELVGCMVAKLKNRVIAGALCLRQNRHPGNEFDRFPAVTCIIVRCAWYQNTISWISMGSQSLNHYLCWCWYSQYFNLVPIVGADIKKRDRWKRDFRYLLVNCSGTEITRKEGHLSRLLLVIGKFSLFRRKNFLKNVIIAAEKN